MIRARRIFLGSLGKCPTCDGKLPVRIGSFTGNVGLRDEWVADLGMLKTMYTRFKKEILGVNVVSPTEVPIRCPACLALKRKMLIWIAPYEGALAGPWCQGCITNGGKQVLEDSNGMIGEHQLYALNTTKAGIARVMESFRELEIADETESRQSHEELELY